MASLIWLIARRYFIAKHKTSFINVLSWISVLGLAIGTAALVIVLSAFNGMQSLIRTMYHIFDADIKIVRTVGKSFELSEDSLKLISQLDTSAVLSLVKEDNALALYRDMQMVVRIKGVSRDFLKNQRLSKAMVDGRLAFQVGKAPAAVVGYGIQMSLGISLDNFLESLQLWYPKNQRFSSISAASAFNKQSLPVVGSFSLDAELDNQYVILPLEFAQELMGSTSLTALEIDLPKGRDLAAFEAGAEQLLGPSYQVLNGDEQHADLFRILKIEKFFVFLALSIILLIASFNIFVALSMLVLDKQSDIKVLHAMGATPNQVTYAFLLTGGMIALAGAGSGMVIGFVVCWLQQKYQLIDSGFASSIAKAYPVDMEFGDFLAIAGVVVMITLLATLKPALQAGKWVYRKS